MSQARTILHVDMNAFFVSVELLRRPELRGQPVVVGGTGERGVVAAASYEARQFGIHSAQPSVRARRLCPHAVFLAGDHAHYATVSRRIMALFKEVTPLVEPLSLDEAFLDVSGAVRHGSGAEWARTIRRRLAEQEQLGCSVGVATTKFVAKLASEAAKPRASPAGIDPGPGVVVVAPGEERAFLDPLPVRALWGVGPATWKRLDQLGVRTIADLAEVPVETLQARLGKKPGRHLHELAHGIDEREVVADQRAKQISHEETFPHDLTEPAEIDRELVRLADATANRVRADGRLGRTVTVKVRFGDFRTLTRSHTLDQPTDARRTIVAAARALLASVDTSTGVRLLGVGLSNLDDTTGYQLGLFGDRADGVASAEPGVGAPAWPEAERAVDQIRSRFGDASVVSGTVLDRPGPRVKRRGEGQWGPDRPDP